MERARRLAWATIATAIALSGCEMFKGESWEEAKRKSAANRGVETVPKPTAPRVTVNGGPTGVSTTGVPTSVADQMAMLGVIQGSGSCGAGKRCTMLCGEGRHACSHVCGAGTNCMSTCEEGGCTQRCGVGANCTFVCSGGDCTQTCAVNAQCLFTCPGGGCKQSCARGAKCTKS